MATLVARYLCPGICLSNSSQQTSSGRKNRSDTSVIIDDTEAPKVDTVPRNIQPPIIQPKDKIEIETIPPSSNKLEQASNKQPSVPPQNSIFVLTKKEREDMLEQIRLRELKGLNYASENDWKATFLNEKFLAAREMLDQTKKNKPEGFLSIQYYFAGILHLYTEGGDLKKAIDYLILADGYRSDINLHLIVAYTKNQQYTKARNMLNEETQWQEKLPLSVKTGLE